MKKIFEKIRGKLGLIEEMYDFIRIVDPVNKSSIIIKVNRVKKISGTCYDFWERELACSNCISMRAYNKKDTFIKIEYIGSKIFLITATPVLIDGEIYILEMLKDVSKNGRIFSSKNNCDLDIYTMINKVNDKFIIDEVSEVYNRQYIDERLPVDINNCNTHGYELSVIKISIDYLKAIEYKYGEEVENKIIRDFVKLVRNLIISNSHWIGRYNEDSFFIVLNNTDK
ncbi:GGDEF domain-containing protein [Clostridium lundense]|uniref:GGDEF domain-containing protein n=1 Tax=Clostridium lundense TaxID=319475 RepID=UPI000485AB9B|nr:diguanylate cyclase [Clostridium lundense]